MTTDLHTESVVQRHRGVVPQIYTHRSYHRSTHSVVPQIYTQRVSYHRSTHTVSYHRSITNFVRLSSLPRLHASSQTELPVLFTGHSGATARNDTLYYGLHRLLPPCARRRTGATIMCAASCYARLGLARTVYTLARTVYILARTVYILAKTVYILARTVYALQVWRYVCFFPAKNTAYAPYVRRNAWFWPTLCVPSPIAYVIITCQT